MANKKKKPKKRSLKSTGDVLVRVSIDDLFAEKEPQLNQAVEGIELYFESDKEHIELNLRAKKSSLKIASVVLGAIATAVSFLCGVLKI